MKTRKVTSLTALLSFLLTVLTSVILYIVPHGRVAYWADWRLWGLTKTQWTDIHVTLGILFVISLFVHIYFNWKPMVSYMKNRAKEFKLFTADFNMALLLIILFTGGTYLHLPPFSLILDFSESIKDAASIRYGEPPWGHAELSTLKTFAKKMGFNLEKSLDRLKDSSIIVESPEQTLKEIAGKNSVSPQRVYLAMKPEKEENPAAIKEMPQTPPPGLGGRPLADVCSEYGLNLREVIRGLSEKKIEASPEMSIKEMAEKMNRSPIDIYEIIRQMPR
jgi:hypothetical protein